MSKTYIGTVEMVLTLPDDFLADVGWKYGDTIKWIVEEDGTITLRKVDGES
jgi:bifunctional DNA-binding transcriptional regulator/antitoxin component of YhaV-PrlF toxin-antitoxin module